MNSDAVISMRDWTVPAVLETLAREHGGRNFIQVVGGGCVSYGDSYRRARSIARGLHTIGIEAGAHVAVMGENSIDTVLAWLGINLAGAVEVPLNTGYRGRSLLHVLTDCAARAILVDESLLPRLTEVARDLQHLTTVVVFRGSDGHLPDLRGFDVLSFQELSGNGFADLPAVSYHDVAAVIYTSGTTGPAKGVVMPHAQIHQLARSAVEGLRMTAEDVYYCYHPMYHMAGKFMAVYASMLVGARVVLDTRFSAEDWLNHVRRYEATVSVAHGPMVEMIHRQPELPDDAVNPMTRLQASPFPARIAEDFERRFGLRGIEVWGMTEINVPCWRPYDEPLRVGSCGRVQDDWYDVRVVDPDTDIELANGETGELVVRPRLPWTAMQGYLNMPADTLAAWRNLWFHTGDRGYFDAEGYLYFVDRVKERIRRRAENVSAYEIEVAALEHPGVAECAAVGVASEFTGDDDIKLCVVADAAMAPMPEELLGHLVTRLPHYMVPRYVEFRESLPRTPTEKVQKSVLRERGAAGAWDRSAAGISIRTLAAARERGQ